MSKTVDEERAEDAERARLDRAIVVLRKLIQQVEMRREELPVRVIADRLERSPATVYRREATLREILSLVGSKEPRGRE